MGRGEHCIQLHHPVATWPWYEQKSHPNNSLLRIPHKNVIDNLLSLLEKKSAWDNSYAWLEGESTDSLCTIQDGG
jgi:hypothetical protein